MYATEREYLFVKPQVQYDFIFDKQIDYLGIRESVFKSARGRFAIMNTEISEWLKR